MRRLPRNSTSSPVPRKRTYQPELHEMIVSHSVDMRLTPCYDGREETVRKAKDALNKRLQRSKDGAKGKAIPKSDAGKATPKTDASKATPKKTSPGTPTPKKDKVKVTTNTSSPTTPTGTPVKHKGRCSGKSGGICKGCTNARRKSANLQQVVDGKDDAAGEEDELMEEAAEERERSEESEDDEKYAKAGEGLVEGIKQEAEDANGSEDELHDAEEA